MVHGGLADGDKAHANVVHNKVARWVPQGVAGVGQLPPAARAVAPLEQARDVARALAQA